MSSESQIRATFNDTKKKQEELRLKLDTLDYNNLYVEPDERGAFFDLIADSLLGLDFEKEGTITLPDNTILNIKNLGEFIRFIIYYDKQVVSYEFFKKYNKIESTRATIGQMWHELKFLIFGIYPEALAMSIRISKEREKRDSSLGASIDEV